MSKRVILGGAVKAIREAKSATDDKYKLGRFASLVNLSSGHLCNIEASRKSATDETIERIATELGVKITAISYEVSLEAAS